jgi:hypothetical protein
MALCASGSFGAFGLEKLAVLVNVMTLRAVFNLGLLVVRVMVEDADRTFQSPKGFKLEVRIVFGKSRNTAQRYAEYDRTGHNVSE